MLAVSSWLRMETLSELESSLFALRELFAPAPALLLEPLPLALPVPPLPLPPPPITSSRASEAVEAGNNSEDPVERPLVEESEKRPKPPPPPPAPPPPAPLRSERSCVRKDESSEAWSYRESYRESCPDRLLDPPLPPPPPASDWVWILPPS